MRAMESSTFQCLGEGFLTWRKNQLGTCLDRVHEPFHAHHFCTHKLVIPNFVLCPPLQLIQYRCSALHLFPIKWLRSRLNSSQFISTTCTLSEGVSDFRNISVTGDIVKVSPTCLVIKPTRSSPDVGIDLQENTHLQFFFIPSNISLPSYVTFPLQIKDLFAVPDLHLFSMNLNTCQHCFRLED